MSTYVIGDIHGCYYDFQEMLKLIGYSEEDEIVMVGDYIDRGVNSFEMLEWIKNYPNNFTLLKGNHEQEYILMTNILLNFCNYKALDYSSLNVTKYAYETTIKLLEAGNEYFDRYNTLYDLIYNHNCTIEILHNYANILNDLLIGLKVFRNGKIHIITHAGYLPNSVKDFYGYKDRTMFTLYAREEAFLYGGIKHGVVISGHNPTTEIEDFCFNNGNVFYYYNKINDCEFYDIDCGCVFKNEIDNAKLACIRLEDKEIFYF